MKIDDMPAGREMDARLYKALGYRVEWLWCWEDPECGTLLVEPDQTRRHGDDIRHPCYWVEVSENEDWDNDYWEVVPFVSIDIDAAWEVVEKMREKGYGFSLSIMPEGCEIGFEEWFAGFIPKDHLYGHPYSKSAIAPLAICRAALKAMGIKEGE